MKSKSTIVLSVILLFSIVIFSSFKAYPSKQNIEEVKKESKETKKEESKTELISLEYEATMSVGLLFTPLQFSKIVISTYVVFSDVSENDFDFELKLQELYRIIFTHIISKNAP